MGQRHVRVRKVGRGVLPLPGGSWGVRCHRLVRANPATPVTTSSSVPGSGGVRDVTSIPSRSVGDNEGMQQTRRLESSTATKRMLGFTQSERARRGLQLMPGACCAHDVTKGSRYWLREMKNPVRGFVEHRGCRLAYSVLGSGPPIVFIQGVGLHGAGWRPQTDELSSSYSCLTFDNRGVGESQPTGGRLSIAVMAEDTLRVMDAAGFESAHLVGHSMGGCIALQTALTARGRVRSLSLLCTVARGRDATRLSLGMLWIGIRSTIGTARARRRAFLELVLAPNDLTPSERDTLAVEVEPMFGHDLARRPPIAMTQLAALRAYDPRHRLAELGGLPTLVANATYDRIATPASGRLLAESIPGARYVEFGEHSHGVVIRDARRVNALLKEHVAAAEKRPASEAAHPIRAATE